MLRAAQEHDLRQMHAWRNQPANREVSNNQHVIPLAEHLAWWSEVKNDPTRLVLMFEVDGRTWGVVNFFDLRLDGRPRTGSWGFFLDHETATGEGVAMLLWTRVMSEAVGYAFDELRLDQLNAEVLQHNESVRAMNRRYGFAEGSPTEREVGGRSITVIPVTLHRDGRRRSRRGREK